MSNKLLLNDEQSQAVYSDDNTLVIAGAGSGKTTVLAARVIRLMIDKQVGIEEILCLTFTKKATAEMYSRIYLLLEQCIGEQDFLGKKLSSHTIDFLTLQQTKFNQAQIMTLDAFSLQVAQIGMNALGNSEPISIHNDIEGFIHAFSTRWLYAHPKSNIHDLLAYYTFDYLISELISPVLKTASCFENDMEYFATKIIEQVVACIEECRVNILESARELHSKMSTRISLDMLSNTIKQAKEVLHDLVKYMTTPINEYIRIDKITYRTKPKMDPIIKEEIEQLKIQLNTYIEDYNMLSQAYFRDGFAASYSKYYEALQVLIDDWNIYRIKNGVFSYSDIAEIAQHTLEHNVNIQKWYSEKFSFIIIDEFQDNNMIQKRLLYTLSKRTSETEHTQKQSGNIEPEPGKYFFVGDPKQSIYKFRGADLDAFFSLEEDNVSITMDTNYRSDNTLIALFNTWFAELFTLPEFKRGHLKYKAQKDRGQGDNNTDKSVLYKALTQEEQALISPDWNLVPCMFDVIQIPENTTQPKPSADELRKLEAYNIARRIHTMHQQGIALHDIAVLSYAKNIFEYLTKYLLELGISYSLEDSVNAIRQDIGKDFYSWLQLLIFPEDRGMYAAVLRSPLAHLSDNMVLALLSLHTTLDEQTLFTIPDEQEEEGEGKNKIRETINSYVDDKKSLQVIREKYLEARQLLLQGDLLKVLEHFWCDCGYRYLILKNTSHHVFLNQYYVLRNLIIEFAEQGTMQFLHTLREILQGSKSESSIHFSASTNGVNILTIHKSKGLEFPYVILADMNKELGRKTNSKDNCEVKDDVLYITLPNESKDSHLINNSKDSIPYSNIMNFLKQEDNQDELLRILYVGATRAQHMLILSGTYNLKSNNETIKSYLDAFKSCGFLVEYNISQKKDQAEDQLENQLDKQMLCNNDNTISVVTSFEYLSKQLEADNTQIANSQLDFENKIQTFLQDNTPLNYQANIIEVSPSRTTTTLNKNEESPLPSLEVDKILLKYNIYSSFGIYCHYLLSKFCTNRQLSPTEIAIPTSLEVQLLALDTSTLDTSETNVFIQSAFKACEKFLGSPLWKENIHAQIYVEYPFLIWSEPKQVWVRGIIDLIIITDSAITIVDYKVDRYCNPQKYTYQLASYALAVQKIFLHNNQTMTESKPLPPKKIEKCLFYLRNGEIHKDEFDIDELELMNVLCAGLEIENDMLDTTMLNNIEPILLD